MAWLPAFTPGEQPADSQRTAQSIDRLKWFVFVLIKDLVKPSFPSFSGFVV